MRQSERAADDHQLEATHTTSTRPTPARGWASGPLIEPASELEIERLIGYRS